MKSNSRVAIVTGSSKGIGFSIAETLAHKNVKILLISRKKKNLISACKKLKKTGAEVQFLVGDLKSEKTPKKAINICIKKWGRVDILINNTGGPPPGTILNLKKNDWENAIQNNLKSVVRFTTEILPIMKKQKWGRIVTINSTRVKEPSPNMILSATSRGGLLAFNKAIAIEFAKYNITSNIISPGAVSSERFINLIKVAAKNEKKTIKKKISEIKKLIPANRIADPIEIANTASFLVSEKASYITGINLSVDGGFTKSY